MSIKEGITILWDLDGTLFDTYPMFTEIFRRHLPPDVFEDEILRHLKVSYSHAARHFGLDEGTVRRMREMESDWPLDRIRPFPGVEKVLQWAEANVIVTHKWRRHVDRLLSYYDFGKYFVAIVSGDDGFPRKPNPASYRFVQEKVGIDLVIGDRILDIEPGKILGIKTCLFQNHEPGADFYLDDFRDFFEQVAIHFSD